MSKWRADHRLSHLHKTAAPGGELIAGATGGNYRIETTSDLVNTNIWTMLTNLTLPSSPFDFIDRITPQPLRRFYRAIPVP